MRKIGTRSICESSASWRSPLQKKADGFSPSALLFPGTGANACSPRCTVLSSIVKHRQFAIDPVTASWRLYAAPTQEEGRSNIPANFRPTTELSLVLCWNREYGSRNLNVNPNSL